MEVDHTLSMILTTLLVYVDQVILYVRGTYHKEMLLMMPLLLILVLHGRCSIKLKDRN